MELQELYNSQQLLTAELSDRLEKTEVLYASVVKYRPYNFQCNFLSCSHSHLAQELTCFCCLQLQKKLEETEHALFDLEGKHRQANATIKEKEFLISNLLKSGQ